MNLRFLSRATPCVLLAAALLALGCGKGGTELSGRNKVSGKLTKNGQPLEKDPVLGAIDMMFLPMKGDQRPDYREEGGEEPRAPGQPPGVNAPVKEEVMPFGASVEQDGSFSIPEGVPDGKYLVVIRVFPKGRPAAEVPLDRDDSLKGAFSAIKSKVIRDVKGDTVINIDVGKPGG